MKILPPGDEPQYVPLPFRSNRETFDDVE